MTRPIATSTAPSTKVRGRSAGPDLRWARPPFPFSPLAIDLGEAGGSGSAEAPFLVLLVPPFAGRLPLGAGESAAAAAAPACPRNPATAAS